MPDSRGRKVELDGPLADSASRDHFVRSHPEGTYAHLSAWSGILRRAYGLHCWDLRVVEGSRVLGVLTVARLPGPLSPRRLVSLPFLDLGGPLAVDDGAEAMLREHALRIARQTRCVGLDLHGPQTSAGPEGHGPRRFRFLLSLEGDEEALAQRIGTKIRRHIRKSEREELTTRREDPARLDEFYPVFARNMHDLGSPVHSFRYFREFLEHLPGTSLYLTRDRDDRVVAGGLAVRCRHTAIVPWASALRETRPLSPNHSLYWRVLRDMQAEGAREFDFGRSSEGTGTYNFKKQWGATPTPLVWHFLDPHGEIQDDYYFAAGKDRRAARIWKTIPRPIATLIGPALRRQLPN